MLQSVHFTTADDFAQQAHAPVSSFFFPDQFGGRATLSSLLALAQAHGRQVPDSVADFAASMGIGLPSQVGVQDVMRAAKLLGLDVQLEQVSPQDLAARTLPVLLFSPASPTVSNVLVLAHCDSRYAVTHDHACSVPLCNMGPLRMLAEQWAPVGAGWCLSVAP